MHKNWFSFSRKFGASLPLIMILAACGGTNSAPSVAPTPPPPAANKPPVADAKSEQSVTTEGQPFEVSAEDSSDEDGDSLTYSWQQTAGPAVDIAAPTTPTLSLTAPILDADATLSFEVTVSDGKDSRVATVSLDVENLDVKLSESQATPYGTGGPTNPAITVADPSEYEGNKPLLEIIGLTPTTDGGYTVHWTPLSAGKDVPVSAQNFSADGERVGPQTDGVFLGGVTGQYERDGRTFNRVQFGATYNTVMSGDELYYLNVNIELDNEISLGFNTHRGPVEGEVQGYGDNYLPLRADYENILGGDHAAIGTDQLLSVFTTLDGDAPELVLTSVIIDRFGTPTIHVLSEMPTTETTDSLQTMTAAVYDEKSYLVAYSSNTSENGYDIVMQRANMDGNILGNVETINTETAGDQIAPLSAVMSDGNIFVTWFDHTADGDTAKMSARIVRPDGTFATDEIALPPTLPRFDPEDQANEFYYALTALNSNEVMISWRDETSGASELRALVIDGDLAVASNEFTIASGGPAEYLSVVRSLVLPDNRVIMAWANEYSVIGEPLTGTSHSVGFYPVGKRE